ncbi:methylenetetrahydrofolate reductase [Motilibacter aurantiacus]|uniref:methylenetetrahydrofolate reductase n=1 Tax=Motilibacter aurantiacus TaxID=2714955 RepID=UPI001408F45F|nr:5,10-methylenetetrahydrofolate reductase [Motilibacter aurantiacus]
MTTVVDRITGRFVSIELLPPRTPESGDALESALVELRALDPAFVAVTYGAGGSDRGRTEALVERLADGTALPLPHLTCLAHSRAELEVLLDRYVAAGVRSVLALRGDPPLSATEALPEGDLRRAVELVELARARGVECVGVAVHPEGHPAAQSRESDLRHQAAKLGEADFALTQFVNRSSDYFRFVDEMARRGATAPVIPGIRPIANVRQAVRMAEMSGAPIPAELLQRLESAPGPAAARRIGVEHAVQVCRELLDGGAPGLHFYTMNRAASTLQVCAELGWEVSPVA